MKASDREKRQNTYQCFRQALRVKVTLPGAEPELQAEKDVIPS